jgi:NADH-quinone oxidoreductase subunit N
VIALIMSMVSLYYYLMVIKELYISEPEEPELVRVPVLLNGLAVALVVGVFYVGIYPTHLYEAAQEATKLLF